MIHFYGNITLERHLGTCSISHDSVTGRIVILNYKVQAVIWDCEFVR